MKASCITWIAILMGVASIGFFAGYGATAFSTPAVADALRGCNGITAFLAALLTLAQGWSNLKTPPGNASILFTVLAVASTFLLV